ncbi:hypothetical protein FQN54_004336 [Arachnomyces sp. PD_36]|nr:hypothetical protein FQN54_004336 [Arachnomyces sp. PD_36]
MGLFRRRKQPGASNGDEAEECQRTIAAWSPEERTRKEKAYVRHIDRRLLPMLILMYILNYIDRNALPHARLQNLEEDLGLEGYQYNTVLSLTFIGYILMQIPSNMILGKTRPSLYLPGCMIAWGVVSGATGAVQGFSGLAACRFFLGCTEAPYFAGAAFLFSGWYTKRELGARLGILFCGAMLSGAFAGLFAAGIAAAFKDNRIASWRWLFIIEGAATVVVALAAMFVIPDWPSTTTWLSEEERQLGIVRLIEDAGEEDEEITPLQGFVMAMKDGKLWLAVTGQVCVQGVASLTNFLPTLVSAFGFGNIHTLLLTAPPYVVAAAVCVGNTYWSDRNNMRSLHMIVPLLFTVVAIIITMATVNTGARYFALMVMVPGSYSCFQVSNAWAASVAARPKQKRATALALSNSLGNTALIWTPYLYPESDGPRYIMAWSVNLALCAIGIGVSLALRFILQRANKKMDQREEGREDDAEYAVTGTKQDMTEMEAVQKSGLGVARFEKEYRYQI